LKAPQNAGLPSETTIVFEIDFVPTEGTRLLIVRSGDFGRLPLFWAALRQAMRSTVCGCYI